MSYFVGSTEFLRTLHPRLYHIAQSFRNTLNISGHISDKDTLEIASSLVKKLEEIGYCGEVVYSDIPLRLADEELLSRHYYALVEFAFDDLYIDIAFDRFANNINMEIPEVVLLNKPVAKVSRLTEAEYVQAVNEHTVDLSEESLEELALLLKLSNGEVPTKG